jgi:hypothetical protein
MTRNKANSEGATAQAEFDTMCRQYRRDYGIVVAQCHPEFVPMQWNRKGQISAGFYRETGPPDRHATLPYGLSCWMELKTWKAKNKHTLRKRLHQREFMFNAVNLSGALGFYLVKWRWNGTADWRLYPVASLALVNGGIVFERSEGVKVPHTNQGLPRWYDAIMNTRRVTELQQAPAMTHA